MDSAIWRRHIVPQLSCQTRGCGERFLQTNRVISESRSLNHRTTAKRFSPTSCPMRDRLPKTKPSAISGVESRGFASAPPAKEVDIRSRSLRYPAPRSRAVTVTEDGIPAMPPPSQLADPGIRNRLILAEICDIDIIALTDSLRHRRAWAIVTCRQNGSFVLKIEDAMVRVKQYSIAISTDTSVRPVVPGRFRAAKARLDLDAAGGRRGERGT
jgi:hypothetical protein